MCCLVFFTSSGIEFPAHFPLTIRKIFHHPNKVLPINLKRSINTIIFAIRLTKQLYRPKIALHLISINSLRVADMPKKNASTEEMLDHITQLEARIAELEAKSDCDCAENESLDLERAKKEAAQFISVASHDLREPLRLISSYLGLLEIEFGTELNEQAIEYIHMVINNANRMQRLIESLLTYSKVGQEVTLQRVNLKHIAQHCMFNLSLKIDETQADITMDNLPTVIASESHMMQLLQNLIENAIKFHGKQPPQIHISSEEFPDHWLFSVQDNGIGMRTEYTDKIFTMFQRLHSHDEYPGTGIGLTLCQRIVEEYGGKIWVTSVEGQGSTFYFTLPILHRGV